MEKPTLNQWLKYTRRALEGDDSCAIWDVMCAMRGSDLLTDIKYKSPTTARLRYFCFGDIPSRKGYSSVNDDGKYDEIVPCLNSRLAYYDHFSSHIWWAMDGLRKAGFPLTGEKPVKETSLGYT